MTKPPIRLEPVFDIDGSRYSWNLVVDFDPDWQDWEIKGGLTTIFSVRFPDELVDGLNLNLPKMEAVDD